MDRCDACGYVYDDHAGRPLINELRALAPAYRARLTTAESARLRGRPAPGVWSALEYACHVRDMFLVQRERLYLARVEDCPGFAPMHREERPLLADYVGQPPERVADQLEFATGLLADAFASLDEPEWERTCRYNFPEPTLRTLRWVASHTLHEGVHHLGDIDRALSAAG